MRIWDLEINIQIQSTSPRDTKGDKYTKNTKRDKRTLYAYQGPALYCGTAPNLVVGILFLSLSDFRPKQVKNLCG